MALRYTRVKDKATGHEYDILTHQFDPDLHTRVSKKHYPDVSRPRPAKPNVKGNRGAKAKPTGEARNADPDSGDAA